MKHLTFLRNAKKMALLTINNNRTCLANTTQIKRQRRRQLRGIKQHRTRAKNVIVPNASLVALSPLIALKFACSGGIGAFVSHILAVPLDVAKTQAQLNPELYKGYSSIDICKRIAKESGVMALTRGLNATFWGYFIQGSTKYGLFNVLKTVFRGYFASEYLIVELIFASLIADMLGSFFLVPFERARIKIVENDEYAKKALFASVKDECREWFLVEGVLKSLIPIYLKQLPYTVIQLVSYDLLVNSVVKGSLGINSSSGLVFFSLRMVSAIIAGVLATVASQPGDTLMTRRYSKEEDSKKARGWLSLFLGLRQRIPMTVMIVVSQLITIDYLKDLLGVQ